MKQKSSAHYQREYRKRLREQGLVKKEIWIRPEHAKRLAAVEKQLRNSVASRPVQGEEVMTDSESMWTTERLQTALLATELFSEGRASAKLIDGVEPSLEIEMHEYGDLPIYMSVFGEQIIAESLLWPALDVEDVAGFNDAILRTHKYFPLSTVSLDRLTDGKEYYQMFGALSATSRIHNVLLEIETLASNVIQATEAYADFLRYPQAAGME